MGNRSSSSRTKLRLACTALLLVPLVVGLSSARGGTLSISTVTVEVIGKGSVTSAPAGLECGNGATTCYLAFSGSGSVVLTPAPATDWAFDSWSDCPTTAGQSDCEIAIDGSAPTVTANFRGPPVTTSTLSTAFTGSGSMSGGDIDCGSLPAGASCTWTVLTGSTLTVREAPAPDNVFTGWGGACAGTNVVCTVELTSDRSVTAAWTSSTGVLLTVSVSGGGTVTGAGIECPSTCAATQALNSTALLTAKPADGYVFAGWGGACTGVVETCAVLMSDAKSVTAAFAHSVELRVAVSGSGNVSGANGAINCGSNGETCSALVPVGSTVSLSATPAARSAFSGWSGACGGASTSCSIVMNAAKSVTAAFKSGTALLTVRVTGLGRVGGGGIDCGNGASSCSSEEPIDSDVTLTASPATGATFTGWSGACAGTGSTCTVAMTTAKSVSAAFAGGSSTSPTPTAQLTVTISGHGVVTGGGINCGQSITTCSATISVGANVTLTATPASGSTFGSWSGACSGSATTCAVTMSGSKSVSASFGGAPAAKVALTVRVTGPGMVSSYAGRCSSSGPIKTCTQRFDSGQTVVVNAYPAGGAKFKGWGGACTGSKKTCTVLLDEAQNVAASFAAPFRLPSASGLTKLGSPKVTRSGALFLVSLPFRTTRSGTASLRALLDGRVVATSSRVVRAGAVVLAIEIAKPGSYTFEIQLRGHTLRWRTCLGSCRV